MKRKLLIFTLILTAAVLAFAVWGGKIFLESARYGEAILQEAVHDYEQTPSLGKLYKLEVSCALPWGQDMDGIAFLPGEGIVQQGNINVATTRYTARGRTKLITIPLKSYRTGKLEPGTLQATITRNFHNSSIKKQTLSKKLKVVEFAPLKVENPDQLPLADAAAADKAVDRSKWYFIAAGAIVFVMVLCMLWWLKKRHNQLQKEVLPPWVIARNNLEELRKTAIAGKQPLEWCVAKLSDVVREYLSIRFSWRVKQQTTEEFFASLKRKSSPLSAAQTFYLEEFMKQSDLVKFANIKPDKEAFTIAVDRADELVEQTGIEEKSANAHEVKK